MITLKEVLFIHKRAIAEFGGTTEVRDYDLLEYAIQRPFATFDNNELYPEIEDKAAAILESIIKNHPFIDGNKRTGYILMRYLLIKSEKDIQASVDEKYAFVMHIAQGNLDFEQIRQWINSKIR